VRSPGASASSISTFESSSGRLRRIVQPFKQAAGGARSIVIELAGRRQDGAAAR